MLTIIQANGAALQTDMQIADFQAALVAAAPSPWISITDNTLGTIYLNTFTIAYYYYS